MSRQKRKKTKASVPTNAIVGGKLKPRNAPKVGVMWRFIISVQEQIVAVAARRSYSQRSDSRYGD
jgi:hypothetical protein